jgi:hypothetical protein
MESKTRAKKIIDAEEIRTLLFTVSNDRVRLDRGDLRSVFLLVTKCRVE